jgi:hypothetical protein
MRRLLQLGLAWLLLPGILPAQSLLTNAPERCIWHAGDNLHCAATELIRRLCYGNPA